MQGEIGVYTRHMIRLGDFEEPELHHQVHCHPVMLQDDRLHCEEASDVNLVAIHSVSSHETRHRYATRRCYASL